MLKIIAKWINFFKFISYSTIKFLMFPNSGLLDCGGNILSALNPGGKESIFFSRGELYCCATPKTAKVTI